MAAALAGLAHARSIPRLPQTARVKIIDTRHSAGRSPVPLKRKARRRTGGPPNEKPRLMGITERGKSACNVEAPAGAPPIRSYHRVHGEQSLRCAGPMTRPGPLSTGYPPNFRRLFHRRPSHITEPTTRARSCTSGSCCSRRAARPGRAAAPSSLRVQRRGRASPTPFPRSAEHQDVSHSFLSRRLPQLSTKFSTANPQSQKARIGVVQ